MHGPLRGFEGYARLAPRHPDWVATLVLGRVVPLRRSSWRRCGPEPPDATTDGVVTGDVRAASAALRTDGICTGLRLRDDVVADLREFARTHECFADGDATRPVDRNGGPPPGVLRGDYLAAVERDATVARIMDDPALRALACSYLDDAYVLYARMWWSYPSTGAERHALHQAGQAGWHYDLDAWRTVKVFTYLTDVDDRAGPHRYLRGSHRRHPLRQQLSHRKRISDAAALAAYGPDAELVVNGPAGTMFAADPFGYHTGTPPMDASRLVLEVQYAQASRLLPPERTRRAYAARAGRA